MEGRATSFRQIEANRRNATRSTGPVTEAGKQSSRQNAIRHGLCTETVVGVLQDVEDYKGFEAAIIVDFNAETAVERELVLRLASLLWRIRRATSIEAEIFRIQAEILQERRLDRSITYPKVDAPPISGVDTIEARGDGNSASGHEIDQYQARSITPVPHPSEGSGLLLPATRQPGWCDLRTTRALRTGAFRQIAQTLFLLRGEKRRRRAEKSIIRESATSPLRIAGSRARCGHQCCKGSMSVGPRNRRTCGNFPSSAPGAIPP
jgi:hypothetical protein